MSSVRISCHHCEQSSTDVEYFQCDVCERVWCVTCLMDVAGAVVAEVDGEIPDTPEELLAGIATCKCEGCRALTIDIWPSPVVPPMHHSELMAIPLGNRGRVLRLWRMLADEGYLLRRMEDGLYYVQDPDTEMLDCGGWAIEEAEREVPKLIAGWRNLGEMGVRDEPM